MALNDTVGGGVGDSTRRGRFRRPRSAAASGTTGDLTTESPGPNLRLVPDPAPGGSDLRAELPRLYEEHYRSLVRLASFNVDDLETAEEVVQDAFVKLVGGNYDIEPGKEAGYLRSMVLNGARSALRKRQVRRAHTPDPPGLVAAAEDGGVASAEHDRVIAALRQLPEQQASVLALRYYLDLTEADIADTLGIARGSVKSHAHRGLKKLADLLGDDTPPSTGENPS